jgi:hypothetical protein
MKHSYQRHSEGVRTRQKPAHAMDREVDANGRAQQRICDVTI